MLKIYSSERTKWNLFFIFKLIKRVENIKRPTTAFTYFYSSV